MKKIGIFSTTFLIIDQIIKFLVCHFMEPGQSITVIPNFFQITYVKNTGAAWSILEGNTILLILITFFALFCLYEYFLKGKTFTNYEVLTYSLLIGGILGNLFDRIFYHYVIDYLSFNLFSYPFPVFNFADMGIVIGVGLLIILILRGDQNERN